MNFRPTPASTLAVTAAGTFALPNPPHGSGGDVVVRNKGSADAYVEFGQATVTAAIPSGTTAGSMCIPAGQTIPLRFQQTQRFIAVAVASGTPSLEITVGEGAFEAVAAGGSAGSTGSVTAAGTNGTQAQAVQGIMGGVPQPVVGVAGSAVLGYIAQSRWENLSRSPLAANASFNSSLTINTGGNSLLPYAYVTVTAFADVAGTLYVSDTNDNANFYPLNGSAGSALAAGASVTLKIPLVAQFINVVFTNGATAQTNFRLNYMLSAA